MADKFIPDRKKYVEATFRPVIFDGHDYLVFRDEKDDLETITLD